MFKALLIAAGLAVAIAPLTGYAQSKPGELRFGVDPTFKPYEYRLPDGSLTGFDIDIGNALCDKMHVKCVWVQTAFDSVIPALEAKKFDAILSGMTATPKRRQQLDFTSKIYAVSGTLVAKCGSALQPNAASLAGKRIGVGLGSSQEQYAQTHWAPKGVILVSYPDMDKVHADLISGRLDASFDSAAPAQIGFLDLPQGKGFCMVGHLVKDKDLVGDGTAIGLPKGSTQLREKLNAAIAAIHKDGTYDKIAKKYFTFDVYGG